MLTLLILVFNLMDLDELFKPDHEKVADMFDMNYKQLSQLIYPTTANSYRSFSVLKKNGGQREINAPKKDLRDIQKVLAYELAKKYVPRSSTQGFVKGRSITTNAKRHNKKKFVFNIDIKDFF